MGARASGSCLVLTTAAAIMAGRKRTRKVPFHLEEYDYQEANNDLCDSKFL